VKGNHADATGLVAGALARPRDLLELRPAQWDELLCRARNTRLLGRLSTELEALGLLDSLPSGTVAQIRAELAVSAENARMVRWEVDRIRRALRDVRVPVILLKGAAYLFAGLPPAAGRLSSDVDIMVPKNRLADVEGALLRDGYEAAKLDPYDQRYYRTWMHELPPLWHRGRQTVVDVHHTILPETGRVRPDAGALIEAARPLRDGLHILAPPDMVLHSAAHLFQDGDLDGGLRDLVDLDLLLRHFGVEPSFWEGLVSRAFDLTLARPLYYALRYGEGLLGTPVPAAVAERIREAEPPWPVREIMDALTRRAVRPDGWEAPSAGTSGARLVLYVRSHWLRMPPWLLTRHLGRKTIARLFPSLREKA
jgi:hypothetical protein